MFLTSVIHVCSGAITSGEASASSQAGSSSVLGSDATTYGIVFGFLLLAAVCTLAVSLWATLRIPRPAFMPQLSPDGRYWGEGGACRPPRRTYSPPKPSVPFLPSPRSA